MIEPSFTDDLRLLANSLRTEGFRFILVRHNRFSIYRDISAWLREQFANRSIVEFHFEGKDYRTIIEFIRNAGSSIILIPDFDWLFREGNESICVGFNQRRDALAQLPVALVCFVQPSTLRLVSKRLPDWWSLRSMELEFVREEPEITPEFLSLENRTSSLGGHTREEKKAELERLMRQIEISDPENNALLISLYSEIGQLYYDLSDYDNALEYWKESLRLCRIIENRQDEITILNNISQIYVSKGKYDTALANLNEGLRIAQEIGDTKSEGWILNNIGQFILLTDKLETALDYFQRSLNLHRIAGNKQGEGMTLKNIGRFYFNIGNYNTAIEYLEKSLDIFQSTEDHIGRSTVLNDLGDVSYARGDYDSAIQVWQESLNINKGLDNIHGIAYIETRIASIFFHQNRFAEAIPLFIHAKNLFMQISAPDALYPEFFLNAIIEKIGQARFDEIVSKISTESR